MLNPRPWIVTLWCTSLTLALGCPEGDNAEPGTDESETAGSGDGDGDGDGDGEPGDGDGDGEPGDGDGDGEPGDGDGEPGDGDGEPGDGDGEPGDGDGDGDGDGLGDPTLCASGGWASDEVIALIVDEPGAEVALLRADGSTIPLDTSLPNAAPDAELEFVVDTAGAWVFVAVYDGLFGVDHHLAHYRVYDRSSGAVAWEYADAMWEPQGRPPHLAADGRVALFVYSPYNNTDNSYSQVLGAGEQIDLYVGDVGEAVGADDWLPIEVGEGYPRWRNVISQQQLGPSYAIYDGYNSAWLSDGTLVYLAEIDGSMNLVEQRVDAIELIPWPELDPYLFTDWWITGSSLRSSPFVTISNGQERKILRLLDGDVSQEWPLSAPPGYYPPECGAWRFGFDAEGRLLTSWRDPASARLFSQASPDADWALVPDALPLAENVGVGFASSSGTTIVRGFAQGETYCFMPGAWDNPPPEALLGSSLQIIRPVDGTLIVSSYGSYPSLTAAGRCSARPLSGDPAQPWRIEDLAEHSEAEVPMPGILRWLPPL